MRRHRHTHTHIHEYISLFIYLLTNHRLLVVVVVVGLQRYFVLIVYRQRCHKVCISNKEHRSMGCGCRPGQGNISPGYEIERETREISLIVFIHISSDRLIEFTKESKYNKQIKY